MQNGSQPLYGEDPFVSAPSDARRHRFSGLNNQAISSFFNGSSSQAKRALEAHLAETDRRLQEASTLGTLLVQQRKELTEKLKEVRNAQEDSEVTPELRQRLAELEREFNEVGQETARVFVAKNRVPSGEATELSGAPSVFSSEASHSPSKIHPPSSRKQRNQQPSRINDIKLATDISSSLLSQIRDLQVAYAEKEDALKGATAYNSKVEVEIEGLRQRLRALDDSEQRYKDENWNLETQLRDLLASSKEAADREQKLTKELTVVKADKSDIEREFDDLKQNHDKLCEDHVAAKKSHDIALVGLRRDVSVAETERGAMQRKIEELTSQNQELAKAVAYRMKQQEHYDARDLNVEEGAVEEDVVTPEQSPPPSPVKGTPRHGHLESETLKSSLAHAHRMVQNLKNNIHREKTEKLELRRMLQEARDELETRRKEGTIANSGKKRKTQQEKDVFKKP
ncbi:hypothetical protein LTS18_007969, partial [Coniosporium uncinatum]